MSDQHQQTCEVCGKPATSFVRDVWSSRYVGESMFRDEPMTQTFHAYCKEHDREPEVYVGDFCMTFRNEASE